jgi:hypothetical protein
MLKLLKEGYSLSIELCCHINDFDYLVKNHVLSYILYLSADKSSFPGISIFPSKSEILMFQIKARNDVLTLCNDGKGN